jgi:hypothetical protein
MSAAPTTGDYEKTGPVEGDIHQEAALPTKKEASSEEDDDDEDIDALIEELESQDEGIDEEEEVVVAGGARTVPEEMLQTSTRTGLTSAEVIQRRKKYGPNQMKEEKENMILKFLGFFVGPIQFVMEVCASLDPLPCMTLLTSFVSNRLPPFLLPVSRIGLISELSALCCCSTLASVSSRNTKPDPSSRN